MRRFGRNQKRRLRAEAEAARSAATYQAREVVRHRERADSAIALGQEMAQRVRDALGGYSVVLPPTAQRDDNLPERYRLAHPRPLDFDPERRPREDAVVFYRELERLAVAVERDPLRGGVHVELRSLSCGRSAYYTSLQALSAVPCAAVNHLAGQIARELVSYLKPPAPPKKEDWL